VRHTCCVPYLARPTHRVDAARYGAQIRGTTTERGYGIDHQRERARLKPVVDAGLAFCQQGIPGNGSTGGCCMPTRRIHPGTPWHLGHNDARTAWIGPVHEQCNQDHAAIKGGRAGRAIALARRRIVPTRGRTSRQW
jgi:hypothetical protein